VPDHLAADGVAAVGLAEQQLQARPAVLSIEPGTNLTAWLYRILRNTSYLMMNRRRASADRDSIAAN
jgi:DNA-directed RNA polymerase specialized sigma24 family protein